MHVILAYTSQIPPFKTRGELDKVRRVLKREPQGLLKEDKKRHDEAKQTRCFGKRKT